MKLLNQSLTYLSLSILAIVTMWAVVFYLNMLSEIKSSIDEGLENYKRLIIQNAELDSSILTKSYFDESFFSVHNINIQKALSLKDVYRDTVIYMQDADDEQLEPEPVRMLTTAFELNGQYYQLKVANSMVEEDDLINELLWDVAWLYLILISGIILVNNFVLRKLWKPFYDLLALLKNFRLGSTQKLPETNTQTKEFRDLHDAVNTFLQHSHEIFEQQKQFIENASHELQTPLAIATNKLELLLETQGIQPTHGEKIGEVFHIIQRLIRLNKSLLLLSKIDNKEFFDNQPILINDVVLQTIREMEPLATFKKVKVSITEDAKLMALMDATLANSIVSNLLKNAILHNVENGAIQISISHQAIKVCNTGVDQALDKERIFNRFQKSNSAAGTGLGLAVVKAVAAVYDFNVSYHFKDRMHCFEIKFSSI